LADRTQPKVLLILGDDEQFVGLLDHLELGRSGQILGADPFAVFDLRPDRVAWAANDDVDLSVVLTTPVGQPGRIAVVEGHQMAQNRRLHDDSGLPGVIEDLRAAEQDGVPQRGVYQVVLVLGSEHLLARPQRRLELVQQVRLNQHLQVVVDRGPAGPDLLGAFLDVEHQAAVEAYVKEKLLEDRDVSYPEQRGDVPLQNAIDDVLPKQPL